MLAAIVLLACAVAAPSWAESGVRQAPAYSPSSIVNAASNQPGALAPNAIVSLFGADLAYGVRALRPEDIRDGQLPTLLPGSGVRVLIANIAAQIYFVSPGQVNLLVPANLKAGPATLQLFLDGRAGPPVQIRLDPASPGLFEQPGGFVAATAADGSLVSPASRSGPGDAVVIYAAGLGETAPPAGYGEIARRAAPLRDFDQFAVTLDGRAVPPGHVLYAGLTPGFAGLYQINLRVPDDAPPDPEVRVFAGSAASQTGACLAVRGGASGPAPAAPSGVTPGAAVTYSK